MDSDFCLSGLPAPGSGTGFTQRASCFSDNSFYLPLRRVPATKPDYSNLLTFLTMRLSTFKAFSTPSALPMKLRQLFLSAVFFLSGISAANAQFSRSDESIAAGIYTLIINTQWENQSAFQSFNIGVLDEDTTFYSVVKRKYDGISVKGKTVNVLHFKSIESIRNTQVLCVNKKFNRKIEKIAKAIPSKGTLLVTNSCGKADYVMVDFNGRLKKNDFDINQPNMEKAGLKLTEQFEDFAAGTVTWKELLVESTVLLDKERAKVAAKEKTINAQKVTINYQSMSLQEKMKLLDEQGTILEEQAKQLETQGVKIDQQKEILSGQTAKIEEQKGILNKQLQELGMQRVIMILFLVVIVLVVGIAFVMYRSYNQKQDSIVKLSEQHAVVTGQKEQIEKILFELTDSIRYALRIQNAVLPSEQSIRGKIPGDYFVMYKPKDIVSGDFFFVDRRNDWTLVAVADCTGHGVPGAFVSMLCISLLNEIVKQQEVMQANLILNELRAKVISSLQQKGIQGEQMDGMDISLLLINNKTMKCQWSGANNPLYIVSSKSKKLEEFKPDKRPISIYPDMNDFTNHEIKVDKGDMLYLFTDGYSDQFGGVKGKKFMSRNFKNLIAENSHRSMSDQNKILDSTIEQWKHADGAMHEQIDDITVLGIRIQ